LSASFVRIERRESLLGEFQGLARTYGRRREFFQTQSRSSKKESDVQHLEFGTRPEFGTWIVRLLQKGGSQ